MTKPGAPRLVGIVLAAGNSSRAGGFKPAYVHDGKALLLHAVDGLSPWCARVVVVGGARHVELAALLADRPGVELAVNPRPEDGMFSSVRAGVSVVGAACDGIFVQPVDCPLVGAAVYAALVAAFAAHDRARAAVPEHSGRGGHPVLLPSAAREAILAGPASSSLRDVLRDLRPVRVAVNDPAVLMDLDTEADLRALGARGKR